MRFLWLCVALLALAPQARAQSFYDTLFSTQPPIISAQTRAYIAAGTAAGAPYTLWVDQTQLNLALNGYIGAGICSNTDALYALAAPSSQLALVNLCNAGTYTATINGTETFTPYKGFKGDGTTGYLDTGFNPSTASGPRFTQNSASMGVYSLTSGTSTAFEAGSTLSRVRIYASSNTASVAANLSSANYTITGATGLGDTVWVRSGASAGEVYWNGQPVAAITSTATGLTNADFWCGGSSGSATYSARLLAFCFAGNGTLTASQVSAFDQISAAYLAFYTLPVTVYVSNAATNGYVVGSDSNNGLSKSAPFLTVNAALATSPAKVIINPSGTAYDETATVAAGSATVEGDPTVYASTGATPTLQSTSTTSLLTSSGTLTDLTLDAQNGVSDVAVTPTGAALALAGVSFKNVAYEYMANFSASTPSLTLTDITTDSSDTPTTPWNWKSNANSLSVRVYGGNYNDAGAQPVFTFSGTIGTVLFAADAGGNFPAVASLTKAFLSVTAGSIANFAAALNLTAAAGDTANLITMNNATISGGSWITGGTYQGNASAYVFKSVNLTCTGGTPGIFAATFTGSQGGDIQAISSSCPNFTYANDTFTSPAAASAYGTIPVIVNMGGAEAAYNNTFNNPVNGAENCDTGGSDGWQTDASNTGAETVEQPLGNGTVAYVSQPWTTTSASSTGHYPYLAATDLWLSKAGNPTGTVIAELEANNAGNPSGTVIATSVGVPIAGGTNSPALTTSPQEYHFNFMPVANNGTSSTLMAASTVYHIVYTGVTGDASDYVQIDANGTTTIGTSLTSSNGTTWTAATGQALRTYVYTGAYGTTMVEYNSKCLFADPNQTAELQGFTSGPIKSYVGYGNFWQNAGYAYTVKNALGGTVYASGGSDANPSATNGILVKASGYAGSPVQVVNNTSIYTGTNAGPAIGSSADTLNAVNPIQPVANFYNNIAVSSASAPAWRMASGGTYQIDYNLSYGANASQANIVTGGTSNLQTWAQWQGLGYDAHGQGPAVDPTLPNESTPASFADLVPPSGSPAKNAGVNMQAVAPNDCLGNAFPTNPSIGACQ